MSLALLAARAAKNHRSVSAYTTLDPAKTGSTITLSGGNLIATGGTSYATSIAKKGLTSGTAYWEVKATTVGASGHGSDFFVGVSDGSSNLNSYLGSDSHGWGIQGGGSAGGSSTNYFPYHSGSSSSNTGKTLYNTGDVVGIAIKSTGTGTWSVWIRGTDGNWMTGDPVAGTSPMWNITGVTTLYPAVALERHNSGDPFPVETLDFGSSAFTYAVPSGFTGGVPA